MVRRKKHGKKKGVWRAPGAHGGVLDEPSGAHAMCAVYVEALCPLV